MFSLTKKFGYFLNLDKKYLTGSKEESFKKFLDQGLKKVFTEFCPIYDYSGKELKLEFVGYRFENPKFSEDEARYRGITYEASLRVTFRLTNLLTKAVDEQEIYFGNIPYITDRETFIINGNERIVISQLLRSPGLYFNFIPFGDRKLFGAKIIPSLGAWLEFQVEPTNILQARVNRKKKVAATTLLKAFQVNNEEINNLFKDLKDQYNIIANTLKKDNTEDYEEAVLLIHSKLKPFEPNIFDNALSFFQDLFLDSKHYSLGQIGRFHFDRRLGQTNKNLVLTKEDLVKIISETIKLTNDAQAQADDIDALYNRRVRSVQELLENQARLGLARMVKNIKDRMSVVDKTAAIVPSQLVYPKIFVNTVKEFFNLSPLSQLLDQNNPLSELEHKRRITASGPGGLTKERAGFDVRDVHPTSYGRICPVQTPEGANIGLTSYLALYAKSDQNGFLQAPYHKVSDGKIKKNNITYLSADAEYDFNIASIPNEMNNKEGQELPKMVEGRVKGESGLLDRKEIELIDLSSQQPFSVSVNLIPFLENTDANRAQMGANMQKQAVVLVKPDIPTVSTGLEDQVGRESGYVILAEADGEVVEVDGQHLTVAYQTSKNKQKKTYLFKKYQKTNSFTSTNQRPLVQPGQKFRKDDVLVDGPATNRGVLALGRNTLVGFLSWQGYNFEDAIIISEKVCREDYFTSIYVEEFTTDVRYTKLGPEEITSDIPNVPEAKLRNLDVDGIIRLGAQVKAGDILVGKITPKKEVEVTPEEKLLRSIFGEKIEDIKDSSLYLEPGKSGKVVRVKSLSREKGELSEPGVLNRISVEIAKLRKISVGDKLANRYGNKGIISIIVPEEDMPFLPDGRPLEVILNPLGVISRMNLGQIFETHLGLAAHKLGYRSLVPAMSGVTEEQLQAELKKAGLAQDGKTILYDGRTGQAFKQKVTVGYMYLLKLIHMVEDKIHARSVGPYSLITQQPLGGKAQFGGQRLGEMEVWALEAYGAVNILDEMLTVKSDDIKGRSVTYTNIIRGENAQKPSVPSAFNLLQKELQGLCLGVDIKREEKVLAEEDQVKDEVEKEGSTDLDQKQQLSQIKKE
ncbi:MAG: DNA-directed RNA polymerase subunit beta [Patescibacteria group bacterium]|nr:DNA-directed RNA polymerase subunit beta [Patescibacteria group bacterium]MCL5257994.1 DNA-directed RNA polymerase subunit beta [Patescibacteria group bacterium]